MDLLIVILVALTMLVLALRRRRRRPSSRSERPAGRDWPMLRHPREDWRYWRDLAILIGLALALLLATVFIAGLQGG